MGTQIHLHCTYPGFTSVVLAYHCHTGGRSIANSKLPTAPVSSANQNIPPSNHPPPGLHPIPSLTTGLYFRCRSSSNVPPPLPPRCRPPYPKITQTNRVTYVEGQTDSHLVFCFAIQRWTRLPPLLHYVSFSEFRRSFVGVDRHVGKSAWR
jgi:hypothetical protein